MKETLVLLLHISNQNFSIACMEQTLIDYKQNHKKKLQKHLKSGITHTKSYFINPIH